MHNFITGDQPKIMKSFALKSKAFLQQLCASKGHFKILKKYNYEKDNGQKITPKFSTSLLFSLFFSFLY